MKAISLHQPYATLIMLGYKHYETRSWKTSHRGPLAIHAAKHKSEAYRQLCATDPEISAILAKHNLTYDTLPLGAVLGTCQVGEMYQNEQMTELSLTELACGDYEPGRYAWTLYDVQALVKPLTCRGFQQLWSIAPEMRCKLLTREALAKALTTRYGGLVQADDIRDLMRFSDADENEVHVQATRDARTDWYQVTVNSAGELDPSTIVQLPF